MEIRPAQCRPSPIIFEFTKVILIVILEETHRVDVLYLADLLVPFKPTRCRIAVSILVVGFMYNSGLERWSKLTTQL